MRKFYVFILIAISVAACTSGRKALDQGNFREAIAKATNRLSQHPDNRKAQDVVAKGYPMAMQFYQEEIDLALSGNDPFKWNTTLSIMQEVNRISDQIRQIPASRRLIPSPKMYTSELADVTQRAAEEHYVAALSLLDLQTKEDAKQAYRHLQRCTTLVPAYKDAVSLMNEAKDRATTRVVIEPLPAPSMRYELNADFFYSELMNRMNQLYPEQSFVNFYSPEEAEQTQLKYPDLVVKLNFMDFYIERPKHYEQERSLKREIEEVYEKRISRDSVRTEKRLITVRGKMKVMTDEVYSAGVVRLDITDFQAKRSLLNNNIPGEFMWQNQYGIFVGDQRVLNEQELAILGNEAVLPPGPQDLFYEFTRPIYSKLVQQMNSFFRRYN
ncbi:hypothetical protein [Mangrovibacterium marinum]|uniref:Uncharacterized protein n=1 Tax=Mangrovibacterium marinum TaxID=1639118 RepID=A0A2T5C0U3_9BACT|nr:hypothetical protein [Mangrovibacterium marinum]PTN08189.1 hypothetical protein C8N47_11075 [Mangrovibacterium marinum]